MNEILFEEYQFQAVLRVNGECSVVILVMVGKLMCLKFDIGVMPLNSWCYRMILFFSWGSQCS